MNGKEVANMMIMAGLVEIGRKKINDDSTLEDLHYKLNKAENLDSQLMGDLLSSIKVGKKVLKKAGLTDRQIADVMPADSIYDLANKASEIRSTAMVSLLRIAFMTIVECRQRADELEEIFPNITPNDYMLWAIIERIYKEPGATHENKLRVLAKNFGVPFIEIDSFIKKTLGLRALD